MFTASGYMASVITFLFLVTYSTISCRAVRLTSFHFKSDNGSDSKSKSTQHCRSFCIKSSSLSFPCCVSKVTKRNTCMNRKYFRNKHPSHRDSLLHFLCIIHFSTHRVHTHSLRKHINPNVHDPRKYSEFQTSQLKHKCAHITRIRTHFV